MMSKNKKQVLKLLSNKGKSLVFFAVKVYNFWNGEAQ